MKESAFATVPPLAPQFGAKRHRKTKYFHPKSGHFFIIFQYVLCVLVCRKSAPLWVSFENGTVLECVWRPVWIKIVGLSMAFSSRAGTSLGGNPSHVKGAPGLPKSPQQRSMSFQSHPNNAQEASQVSPSHSQRRSMSS